MASESLITTRKTSRLRADVPETRPLDLKPYLGPVLWTALAGGFVLLGAANLDLNATEAKLGLTALEPLRPFGQVNGSWDPSIWAGSILPSRLWELAGGMRASSAAVRWPAAIAGVLIGLIVARMLRKTAGNRAAILASACWFGSVGLIDHSEVTGLDLILGLGLVGCLSRMVEKGSDWVAGLFLGWAFWAGGWPPVALVALTTVVIGRKGAGLNHKLLIPTALAIVGWSVWALKSAPPDLWGAALALPLVKSSAWDFVIGLALIGFPWAPFALLSFSASVRKGWSPETWSVARCWMQITIASLIIGTVIPGMALSGRVTALAGAAILAGLVFESLLKPEVVPSGIARLGLRLGLLTVVGMWAAGAVLWGGYVGFAVPFYRGIASLCVVFGLAAGWLGLLGAIRADRRLAFAALAVTAVGLKLGHWGYYVPEVNYRQGQGPWGRAIGQWVPPKKPIYIVTDWPADFTFAIDRPVRRIAAPSLLKSRPDTAPHFVLLHEEDFKHWPSERAGKLVKVADFQDEFGSKRVLAREEGNWSWRTR